MFDVHKETFAVQKYVLYSGIYLFTYCLLLVLLLGLCAPDVSEAHAASVFRV
jgi:hypothetical protein